jgi:leucyl-tRNA synthetase
LVEKLTTNENKKSITKYVADAKTKTDLQRKELQKNKTGIFTGSFAINPFNNKKIPIYVADYVLNSYATGVVMGVPGHDQRDYDFALQYKLPIEFVIKTSNTNKAYEDDGVHINSPLIDGLHINAANEKIIEYLHKHKIGKKVITFKMKD